jgi:hypothetical protein
LSFWDHLRRIAKALAPPPPLSARDEAQRKIDALWDEKRRYDDVVRAASDAVLAAAPAELPRVRDRSMSVGLGLVHSGCCYVLETDADLAFARERQLTDWLERATRAELAARGYPVDKIAAFNVWFATHEDIVRKTGGDYHLYFH